jgi:hypothetical protein|uniref:Uncharacterized protein n=1 Tax=viral metagenome TaxID=1070528 RepID=A0A6C0IXI6_9ZZZZ
MVAHIVFSYRHLRNRIMAWRFYLMASKFFHFDTDFLLFGNLPRPTKHPCARHKKITELFTHPVHLNLQPLHQLIALQHLRMKEHEVRLTTVNVNNLIMTIPRFSDLVTHIVINDPLQSLEKVVAKYDNIELDSFTYNGHQWTCKSFQPPYTPLYTCAYPYMYYTIHFTTNKELQKITMQYFDHFLDIVDRRMLMDSNIAMKMHGGLFLRSYKGLTGFPFRNIFVHKDD